MRLVMCGARPAGAEQTPAVELSVGASFLTEIHTGFGLPAVTTSLTANVDDLLGVTGEVTAEASAYWVLGGPRLSARQDPRRTPYIQILVGPVRTWRTSFVIQPGGGINFRIAHEFGIRVGADYQQIFSLGEPFHGLRLHAGMALSMAER